MTRPTQSVFSLTKFNDSVLRRDFQVKTKTDRTQVRTPCYLQIINVGAPQPKIKTLQTHVKTEPFVGPGSVWLRPNSLNVKHTIILGDQQ